MDPRITPTGTGTLPVVDPRPNAANLGLQTATTTGHNPAAGRTNVFNAPYHAAAAPVTAAGD